MSTMHAEFSPSRLPLLKRCPGFIGGLPSQAATRGTDLHSLIAAAIGGEPVAVSPDDQPIVDYALARVAESRAWVGEPCEVMCEIRLTGQIPGTSGTTDCLVLNEFDARAVVIDWKSGWSDRDEPAENLQLKTYGSAVVGIYGVETLQLWIVELDKQRTMSAIYDGSRLVAETLPEVYRVISAAKTATETDFSAGDHCRWCVRSVTCPAVETSLSKSVEGVTTADPAEVVRHMDPVQCATFLAKWRDQVALAASLVKHVEGRAVSIIEAGGAVPGWEIGNGRAVRKWHDEAEAAMTLTQAFPGIDIYEHSLMSPSAVEKVVGKKAANGLLKSLVKTEHAKRLRPVGSEE